MSDRGVRLLVLVALVSCRSEVRPPPIAAHVSSPPPAVVASPRASTEPTGDGAGETGVVDLREGNAAPVTVDRPAWPETPSPIVDVILRLYGADAELKQDVEIVVRIGSVSRRILTRQLGSTRMGILCPEPSRKGAPPAPGPDDNLPTGQIVPFSPEQKTPAWVSWISFVVGGTTTLVVARASAEALVVQTTSRADGMCDDPSSCTSTRKLAVIPVPPSAKTRGRVVEVEGDGEVPFRLCPR